MFKNWSIRRFLSAACVGVVVLTAAPALLSASLPVMQSSKGHFEKKQDIVKPFVVTLGKGAIVEIEKPFLDVLVANPSLVEVNAINANKLYLVGTNIGDTNLFLLDENGDTVKKMDIHVAYDLWAIQSKVKEFFPNEDVSIEALGEQLILSGTASTPEMSQRIAFFVEEYFAELIDEDIENAGEWISNMMETRGEQQVTLQVKIVEASRSVIKELGVETRFNDPNELLAATPLFNNTPPVDLNNDFGVDEIGPLGQLFTTSQLGLTQDPLAALRLIGETGIDGIDLVELFFNALEQENLINTLAEPNLTTISGEAAGFLAGGEFPVPVGRDQTGNIVIEFRPFGVSLNFRPTVLSDKRISLQMETEVSSLNFEDGIPLTGGGGAASIIPAFDVRRANTTVEMASGGSLMIAGLLNSSATKGLTGLPGINNTPVLGDLMKSDSFLRNESEVMIIITPYLVEPYAEKEAAELIPASRDRPLSQVFVTNIQKIFRVEDEAIFEENEQFGYVLK